MSYCNHSIWAFNFYKLGIFLLDRQLSFKDICIISRSRITDLKPDLCVNAKSQHVSFKPTCWSDYRGFLYIYKKVFLAEHNRGWIPIFIILPYKPENYTSSFTPILPRLFPSQPPPPCSISRVPQAPIHPSHYILTQACSKSKSSIRDALSRRLLRSGQPRQNSRQGSYFYRPPMRSNQFWSSPKSPSRCLRLFLCGWAGGSIKLTQFPVALGEHLFKKKKNNTLNGLKSIKL